MKVLGAYLRDKRKSLNLSIQDTADKLNLAYSTVANMEAGSKNPTLKQLRAYGLIFGCEWIEIISKVIEISNNDIKSMNVELDAVIKDTGYDGADYPIAKQDFDNSMKEFHELDLYFKSIKKEYDDEKAAENLKINNDVEAVIKIFVDRWTTKDSTPVSQKDITDFREEIVHLIGLRVQHLTKK